MIWAAVIVTAAICSVPSNADEPPNPFEVRTIHMKAISATLGGRNAEALEHFRTLHSMIPEDDTDQRSRILREWSVLANRNSSARESLQAIQAEARAGITDSESPADHFRTFVLIHEGIGGDSQEVTNCFLELRRYRGDIAETVFEVARPHLLESESFEICAEYIDVESELAELVQTYQAAIQERKQGRIGLSGFNEAQNRLEHETANMIALYARAGDAETVGWITARAKQLLNYHISHEIFDAASEGTFPKP